MHAKKRLVCCILLGFLLVSACVPQKTPAEEAPTRRSAVGFYFDTAITITAYGVEQSALDAALLECERYEKLLSKTIEQSDVWRMNHANGRPTAVSADTAAILQTAIAVSGASDGMFDITVAPVVALWDFTSGATSLPEEAARQAAAKLVDYRNISLNKNEVTLNKGATIDLGGIAKGYIADQVAAFLREQGAKHILVNLGGNVLVYGGKPDGSAWAVGIQDPDGETGKSLVMLNAMDASVVTSGIYERGFTVNGKRYHHILHPHTGMPVDNELASVTIISESSVLGDALSTACLVLGTEHALRLLEQFEGVEAVFVTREKEITATPGAPALCGA